MATLRKRVVRRKGRRYTYWVVTYHIQAGDQGRRQRSYPDTPTGRADAELAHAEAQHAEALAQYGLHQHNGPTSRPVAQWLDDFAQAIRPNCSERYHLSLSYTLSAFRRWLGERNVVGTDQLSRVTLSEFAQHEQGRVSPKTASDNLKLIHRAVRWGIDEGILEPNLARAFPRIKVSKRKRRVLTEAEEGALLKTTEGTELYPVLVAALYTAIRPGELRQLTCGDIDWEKGRIELPGDVTKNKRPRAVGIHRELLPVLRHQSAGKDANELLFTFRGQPFKRDTLIRQFTRAAAKAGLNGDVTMYCLRHTCATRLAAAGMTPFDLQRVLGHASITTTMIYVNLANQTTPDMNIM